MKNSEVTLSCAPYLHVRPASIVVNVSSLFSECEICLIRGVDRIDTRHVTSLVNARLKAQERVELEVHGPEDKGVAAVIATLIENLHMVPLDDSNRQYIAGLKKLHQELALTVIRHFSEVTAEALILKLQQALGLAAIKEVCETRATFWCKGGMHMLPSTLLKSLSCEFNSDVTLIYETEDGALSSAAISDIYELMISGIRNEDNVTVKAKGGNCRRAAYSVKRVLENMNTIIAEMKRRETGAATSREIMGRYFCDS